MTPIINEDGSKMYQASSPDEVALVKIAENMGMMLKSRSQSKITIVDAAGNEDNFEIIANFPFSSDSKRMGIVTKHLETNRIIFYLKGADTVMKDKVPEF